MSGCREGLQVLLQLWQLCICSSSCCCPAGGSPLQLHAMTIVLVPGLFGVGFAPAAVRRAAAALLASGARLVVVTPGAVSSVHDCAREVFAQLRGGVVDYGEAHAARAGHARYGRTWPALVPEWSAARPVHLVGFSMGGLVCRCVGSCAGVWGRPRGAPLRAAVRGRGG